MTKISTIGLDLAKNVFQVHGVDASGAVVLGRQLRRAAVEKFFAQLPPCLVGMARSMAASRGRIHDRSPIRLPKHQKSPCREGAVHT
jgi:hypothetical protein